MGQVFLAMLSCGVQKSRTNKQLGPCSIQRWDGTDKDGGQKPEVLVVSRVEGGRIGFLPDPFPRADGAGCYLWQT